ncbi:hypothetical protein CEE37_05860 [candidate division LCP-89 bacterium B3_LCP]|uniref:ATP-binding protein n=1 Tax=candidate division LCP-89 bacterium B3_LCP TaxID=2012998 RepID=A0A532V220_UNCL8|nr:MAG: hypothetical protein CEE37_05860 [candidate division LCP-89 bacterium B3_LCP]
MDLFDELILNPINFSDDILTPVEKRLIFDLWIRSIPFTSLMPTRPILALVGEPGSGKSLALSKLMKLLFGSRADVIDVPRDKRDFATIVSNMAFAPLDNVDSPNKWLEDALATSATGANYSVRKLYTTNTMVEFPLNAIIALASHNPHFRRSDVADRLLVLRLERIPKNAFIAASELSQAVINNRAELLRLLFERFQEVIKAFQQTKHLDAGIFKTNFRMADFATLALRWAIHVDRESEVETILDKMSQEQTEFTLEGDEIVDLLELYVNKNDGKISGITGPDLFMALKKLADEENRPFSINKPASFSQYLKNLIPWLERDYKITIRKQGGRRRYLTFVKRTDPSEREHSANDDNAENNCDNTDNSDSPPF